MVHFIIYIFKIVLVTLGLMFLLEYAYNFAFQNGNNRSKIEKVLNLNENEHYDYIFLGSSRTENNIDCSVIEKLTGHSCINLGISGSSIEDSFLLLKLLTKERIPFNQVFMQIDYTYNHEGLTPAFKAGLLPYKSDPVINKALQKEENIFYIRHVPFFGYMINDKVIGIREVINQIFHTKTKIDNNNGFWPKEGVGTNLSGALPPRLADKNQALINMQNLLNSFDKNLYLFTAPYCKNVKNRFYISELENRIPELNNYVYIYDEKEEFFFNCGHLNIEGARDFSRQLISDYELTIRPE